MGGWSVSGLRVKQNTMMTEEKEESLPHSK
jgi:hypothetical protein